MSNFTDFFPAPGGGGGGGGIPKYQEFITSGTFTPSQALINAGGRIAVFIVGGGGGGCLVVQGGTGGTGGEVLIKYITLTNTNAITVTIGDGGLRGQNGSDTIFNGSAAGGENVSALGGISGNSETNQRYSQRLGAGFGAIYAGGYSAAAGSGVFGYGVGGATNAGGSGVATPKANSGSGGGYDQTAGSGFVRVTWFE